MEGLATEPDSSPYYELDLETYDWMRVQTSGEAPGVRAYHTAVVHGGRMIVFGGQDLSHGPDHAVTAADVQQAKAGGFFDLFVLDIASRTWSRIAVAQEAPMLWGHSAVLFNNYMLVYGGFDVTPEEASSGVVTSAPDAPPSCSLNEKVYILDLTTNEWKISTPSPHAPHPVPRGLHVAEVVGAELLIFGGMTFDDAGRAINVNDAWVWDIAIGRWSQVEFCIPYWPSKQLLSAVHEGRLMVCSDLTAVHVLDFNDRRKGWVKYATDPSLMFEDRPQPPLQIPANPILPPPAATPPVETPAVVNTSPMVSPARVEATPARYSPEPATLTPPLHPQPQPQPQPPQGYYETQPQRPVRHIASPTVPMVAPLPPAPALARAPPPPGPSPRAQQAQEEAMERQRMLLEDARKARQEEAVRKLQREMNTLQGELGDLAALKEKLGTSTLAHNANIGGPSVSPHRTHNVAYPPVPLGDDPRGANHSLQVNALTSYLDKLQTHQKSVMQEQKKRHNDYLGDLNDTHAEHVKMLKQRADSQITAQQQIEAISQTVDVEEKLREQMEAIQKTYASMMELQREPEKLPSRTQTLYPDGAVPMVEMLGRLSKINRQPIVEPQRGWGPQANSAPPPPGYASRAPSASVPYSTVPASPMAIPQVYPPAPAPTLHTYQTAPLTSLPAKPPGNPMLAMLGKTATGGAFPVPQTVPSTPVGQMGAGGPIGYGPGGVPPGGHADLINQKASHLQDMRGSLQSMRDTVKSPNTWEDAKLSPARYSRASSSPGAYWEKLKGIMGDDYVAIEGDGVGNMGNLLSPSHSGSPLPRGDTSLEAGYRM